MFKKPLSHLKTSSPLRSSDCRKLKQRVVAAFGLTPEQGDVLVPDGTLSVKFSTYTNETGVAYLDAEGNPLWFTIGKSSEDLIPSIYTLWKKEDLLPFLSTPLSVIPILLGGADLMIPGVIHCPPSLVEHQLVAIRRQGLNDESAVVSPPLAVGRMSVSSNHLQGSGKKGKAVLVIHTWKDHLWEMGSKQEVPEDTNLNTSVVGANDFEASSRPADETQSPKAQLTLPSTSETEPSSASEMTTSVIFTPQEVSEILNKSLLQAITESISPLPPLAFPMAASIFYSNHILPSRPAYPTLVVRPDGLSRGATADEPPRVDTEITIKSSGHKSLTAFLKAAEKSGWLNLKSPQKQQPDVLVTSVNSSHPSVLSHESFVTIKALELKAAKKAAREAKEREAQSGNGEIHVQQLWKPHQETVGLFRDMGESKTELFTSTQISQLINKYIKTHNLVNQNDQAYINLDDLLRASVSVKVKTNAKAESGDAERPLQFMRRDELVKNFLERMQSWYEIRVGGKEVVIKKGTLSPVHVVTKVRQGRKACTLITGFEPFLVIDAQEMADELRKTCAGATSVAPVPGKPAGSSLEIFVQGKQSKAVVDYLQSKRIPKKWIEVSDLTGKK